MNFFKRLFSSEKKESLDQGLEKTRTGFFSKLAKIIVGKSQVDVAVDGLGGEWPTLGLPFFRVVEIDAGIAVEEIAMAGEERVAGGRCHSDRGRRSCGRGEDR